MCEAGLAHETGFDRPFGTDKQDSVRCGGLEQTFGDGNSRNDVPPRPSGGEDERRTLGRIGIVRLL